MVDVATRVWNHKWKIDPIVRSLIDTDFYKLLMCQSIFRNKPETKVTFSLINRSDHVPMAKLIDEGELREQLDHIRSLSLSRGESTWLRGNTFYGKRQMFRPDFMEWFENLRLPDYHLERRGDQYELTFEGSWPEVMLWEIPALSVLMELRGRAVLNRMGRFELQVLYARAMTKLWEKIEALRDLGVEPGRTQYIFRPPKHANPGSLDRDSSLVGQNVDDGFLEARGEIRDADVRAHRVATSGVLPLTGIERRRLHPAETEIERVRRQSSPRKIERGPVA